MSDKVKKLWIFAGETSGDIYGAKLAEEAKKIAAAKGIGLQLAGMGAKRMKEAGVELLVDSTELGVMGIVETLRLIGTFVKIFFKLVKLAEKERPDAVVLIDYPGFNLRLAEKLHDAGIPVIYYISPQVWAWKKGRIKGIVRNVKKMLCIFPFEPAVYDGTGLDVEFIGHPLLEILAPLRKNAAERDQNLVLLLPGSRSNELKSLMAPLAGAAAIIKKKYPQIRFAVPLPREKTKNLALEILDGCGLDPETREAIQVSVGNTRELMCRASAGIAASGTVTVEAAMLGLPLVVTYKVNWISYRIAKALVKLPSITIANLVTGDTVYQERLQYDAIPEKLAEALEDILPGGKLRAQCLAGIEKCVSMLAGNSADTAGPGARAAEAVIKILEGKD